MGFRDAVAALFGTGTRYEGVVFQGPTVSEVLGWSAEELYRTQPHLQTVISFMARNVAHLSLPAYERVSDTDRKKLTGTPLTQLMGMPNPSMTGYELRESLVSDLGLYDIAYWFWGASSDMPSGWMIQPIPPSWVVETRGGNAFTVEKYVVQHPNGKRVEVAAENMLVFHGWNPGKPKKGSAPVDALKNVLAEQIQAWEFRQQLWKRGGRVGTYLSRPKDAPQWSDEARTKFKRNWAEFTGSGGKAGSTPLFEDGIEMKRVGFSAREEQWIDTAKLSLQTVASIYHVNPVMVGILDNANFSNTKEFRKMLYSETLGPVLKMIEDRLNTFLVPVVTGRDDVYFEFNIQAKLAGDFEEQASVLSTSVGAPWLTRNEARAKQNLPAVEGGDELITPLNVLIGGQASPQDGVTSSSGVSADDLKQIAMIAAVVDAVTKDRPLEAKSSGIRQLLKSENVPTEEHHERVADVFSKFYERQSREVLSELGASSEWWDAERWDRELTADLFTVSVDVASEIGRAQAVDLDFRARDYDIQRTLPFLKSVAESRATAVNATTKQQLDDAIADDTDEADVFVTAQSQRVDTGASALVATLAGFAVVEAAKQLVPEKGPTKTWIVTSANPRPEHAAMDGETVPIDDKFSNGADWPGDPVLGAEGVSGCMCGVEIQFEI